MMLLNQEETFLHLSFKSSPILPRLVRLSLCERDLFGILSLSLPFSLQQLSHGKVHPILAPFLPSPPGLCFRLFSPQH